VLIVLQPAVAHLARPMNWVAASGWALLAILRPQATWLLAWLHPSGRFRWP